MLKLVSGQHTNAPGGTLRPAGLSVPPSTDANLSVLALVKSPAAAAAGPQQVQVQQRQRSSSKPSSTTPKTPGNLLAMVHLLDQQLQQLEQHYDGPGQEAGLQGPHMQPAHSIEAPTILSTAQPHVAHAAAGSFGQHHGAGSSAKLGDAAAQHAHQAAGQSQPQHTVEVPNLAHSRAASGQLHAYSIHAPAGKAEATAGTLHGLPPRQHDLSGHKAADQVPQHSRGLMAAGAYVLQPLKSAAGAPKRRSTSPEELPWLQHAAAAAALNMPQPQVSTAAVLQQQMQAQLLPPPRPLELHLPPQHPEHQQHAQGFQDTLFHQAAARRAAADAATAAAAAAAAQAAPAHQHRAEQHALLLQQHQMLQQQQQQRQFLHQQQQQQRQMLHEQQQHYQMLQQQQHQQRQLAQQQQQQMLQQQQQMLKLQQERQQRSQPPRQQQQPQRRQSVQDPPADMEVEETAGALDMLSEIAAAAAAAEEMYAGVPTPMRPDLLHAQALASGAFSSQSRPQAHNTQADSCAPGPSGTSAAAAMSRQQALTMVQQGLSTVGVKHSSISDRATQPKRPHGSAAGTSNAAAHAPAGSGAAAAVSNGVHAEDRGVKRTRSDAWAAAHAAEGLQEQHSHDSSTGRAPGAAADGAIVADSDARAQLGPLPGSGPASAGADAAAAAFAAGLAAQGGGPAQQAQIRAAVAELAALAAAGAVQPTNRLMQQHAALQEPPQLQQNAPAAQGATLAGTAAQQTAVGPVAYLVRAAPAAGNAAYLLYSTGPYAQLLLQQRPPAGAAGAAAAQAQAMTLTAQGSGNYAAAAAAFAAAGGGAGCSHSAQSTVPRRPAVKHTGSHLARAPPTGAQIAAAEAAAAADAEAAEAVDAAAHDLAMFAAAAAAAAAAGTYHRPPARTAAAPAASNPQQTEGRRQRKSAAAAAAFIAAAVAGVDDGMGLAAGKDDAVDADFGDDASESAQHSRPTQRRHNERQRSVTPVGPQGPAGYLDLLAAASSPGVAPPASTGAAAAGEGLQFAAAAARGYAAHPALAALAAADAATRSHSTGASRGGRASSVSGSFMHDADCDTDGADGEAYVPHDEEGDGDAGESEDDERRTSSKNRTTKERVLSNRLAASRSYQRRKEEVLRLEANHARLQMERQALQHALQEIHQELHVHHDIAAAFAHHHSDSSGIAAAAAAAAGTTQEQEHAAAAAFAVGHSAMHGALAQRVRGALEHQQRERRVHADRVEEAALAAAAAAEGLYTDGAGSSGSGSMSH